MMYGADADGLDRLAQMMESATTTLDRSAGLLTALLTSSPWGGGDAETFRSEWSRRHRPDMARAATALSDAAHRLREHAQQQRDASSAAGGSIDGSAGIDTLAAQAAALVGASISRFFGSFGTRETGIPGKWKWEASKDPLYRTGKGDSSDIDPEDVVQGDLGDCFVLAGLKAIARSNPEMIRDMIRDNGDGTYTVTFYENGQPVYVTVDNEFPTRVLSLRPDDQTPFAERGDGELWVRVIEKAYAEHFGGSYGGIGSGGDSSVTLGHLTGQPIEQYQSAQLTDERLLALGAQLEHGGVAATASSLASGTLSSDQQDLLDDLNVTSGHAYAIERIDTNARMVYLDNPHGHDDVVLSFDDFRAAFRQARWADVQTEIDMIQTQPTIA